MKHTHILTSAALLLAAGSAGATHKAWVMKNAGAECSFTSYTTAAPPAGSVFIENETTQARYAVCPIALAGRWGSSASPVFSPARWGAAYGVKAVIENNNGAGSVFDCIGRARNANGTMYFSSTASTTTTGKKALTVTPGSNWGGTLEAVEGQNISSLDLDCRMPGRGTNNVYASSKIIGYQAKMCQLSEDCDPGASDEGPPLEGPDWGGDKAFVQTSGIACVPSRTTATTFQRTTAGMKNTGAVIAGVFCPLSPPADDSWWHERRVETTKVYVGGSSMQANCVGNQTCPECFLSARYHSAALNDTVQTLSQEFPPNSGTASLNQPAGIFQIHADVSVGVQCWVPPGQTIKGVTALMTETNISGGQ